MRADLANCYCGGQTEKGTLALSSKSCSGGETTQAGHPRIVQGRTEIPTWFNSLVDDVLRTKNAAE